MVGFFLDFCGTDIVNMTVQYYSTDLYPDTYLSNETGWEGCITLTPEVDGDVVTFIIIDLDVGDGSYEDCSTSITVSQENLVLFM